MGQSRSQPFGSRYINPWQKKEFALVEIISIFSDMVGQVRILVDRMKADPVSHVMQICSHVTFVASFMLTVTK